MTLKGNLIKERIVKPQKSSFRPSIGAGFLSFACVFVTGVCSLSAQSLTWDPNGNAAPNPSDGSGNWLGTGLWWDGANNVDWNNTTNAGTIAILGAGTTTGLAGPINLGGGTINVGGLRFDSIKLPVAGSAGPPVIDPGTELAYSFTNGVLNFATGSNIDLRSSSSNSSTNNGRIRFDAAIAGQNINIFNDQGSNTSLGLININNASNTWTGNLTLRGNTTSGLFVSINAGTGTLNTLTSVTVQTGASLVSNNSSGFNVGTINITGTGAANRGVLRFDAATQTIASNIVLTGNARIGAGNNVLTPVATITGKISGANTLSIDSNNTSSGTIIFKNNTNDFGALNVLKGNAQIGETGIGTAGLGRVTLNSTATTGVNTAVVSGTGTIAGGLTVTKGLLKPGDKVGAGSAGFGAGLGTLNVGTDLTFNPASLLTVAQLSLAAPAATSDRINVTGNLILSSNGNISVLFDSTYTVPTAGDSWSLIGYTGALTDGGFNTGTNLRTGADSAANEGNLDLPDISASGLAWNVALGSGNLTVTIVPEPSSIALAGLAFSAFAFRRRRSA